MNRFTRKAYTLLFYLFLFVSLALFGCTGDEPEVSERDQFIASLEGTWAVDEGGFVLLNQQDLTSLLEGFELSITSGLDYTTNVDAIAFKEFPFPSSGAFELNEELTQVTRLDGLVIDISISEDGDFLSLSFIEAESTGRIHATSGARWNCGLIKK